MKITVAQNGQNTEVIKKSKFISYAFFVPDKDACEEYLDSIRKEHKDATHICYAYIIDSINRDSDDGEPSGTAGVPMLEVLKKRQLNNTLVVVVRYFGGIKLGAGGLVRAYSKGVGAVLDIVGTKQMQEYSVYCITCGMNITKNIEYLSKTIGTIQNIEYGEFVKYTILVPKGFDMNVFAKYKVKVEWIKDIWA